MIKPTVKPLALAGGVALAAAAAADPALAQEAATTVADTIKSATGTDAGVWALVLVVLRQASEFGSKFIASDATGGMGILRKVLRAIAVYRPAK